jgi:general secretion pathway protein A
MRSLEARSLRAWWSASSAGFARKTCFGEMLERGAEPPFELPREAMPESGPPHGWSPLSRVMYTSYFGLAEPPFSITPDPRYLYMSEPHRDALAHLLYGIAEGGGFVQLTGEIGTGKTTLCRCLLGQLPPRVDVALILNPRVTDVELLATLCDELRIPYPTGTTSRKVLVDSLYRHLLDAHGQGRRTVLVVDEAQDLDPEVLEQIRLLTNLETPTQKLLQIILIGQPELISLLDRDELRQLAQRVTARYHLLPFAKDDTHAYICHRMEVAGQKEKIFTEAAMRRIHRAAGGVPRVINAICDRALLGAYTQDERSVGVATVRQAAREVLGHPVPSRVARRWQWAGGAVVAAALVTGVSVLFTYGQMRLPSLRPLQGETKIAAGLARGAPALSTPASAPAASMPAAVAPGSLVDNNAGVSTPALTATPVAASREPQQPAAGRSPLGQLLDDPLLRADKKSAFASLYALWRLDYDRSKAGLGCERGRAEGLQCLFKTGTWARLRRFNVPAIIELSSPTGERRYATVVSLEEENATLDLGGRRYTLALHEIDHYWDGPFILLWKAPGVSSVPIMPGTRGRDVEWLRQRLSELDGGPIAAKNRDFFDDDLRAQVIAFQRRQSLPADGIVGEETLSHLSSAHQESSVPRLGRPGS